MRQYTIGIDFGSLSGRAVLLDLESGKSVASAVYPYPHGVISEMFSGNRPLEKNAALQHPMDYLEVLQVTVPEVCRKANIPMASVVGIGFDFTACTMLPLNEKGMPLCFEERYREEPHTYVKLWKDHSAQQEADEITHIAQERQETWLNIYGGKISSEWMIPKILKIAKESPELFDATDRFSEAADWIYRFLTDTEIHSMPFAGYKALWNDENGYPSADFFAELHPKLQNLIGTKLSDQVTPISFCQGRLSKNGAAWIGLSEGTSVSVPVLDAHASMPAIGMIDTETLMLILGTSGCHIVNSHHRINIAGICGYVKDGVLPGLYTYEAGQACCGDHFEWFVEHCMPFDYVQEATALGINKHAYLRQKARKLKPGDSGLLALDWFNGNRSILSDSDLSGMILGMTLRTKPEEIYRALIEATAYGTRVIIENFEQSGIAIRKIVASGGIAEKDDLLMQIYANVLNRPILVSDAEFSAARGSAMYAAVACGRYADILEAAKDCSVQTGTLYEPIHEDATTYNRLYQEYKILHDYFGKGVNPVMKKLANFRRT